MVFYGGPAIQPPVTGTTNFTDLQGQYGGAATMGGAAPVPGIPTAGVPFGGLTLEPQVYYGTYRTPGPPVGYGDDINDFILKDPTPPQSVKSKTVDAAMSKFDKMTFEEQRKTLRLLAIGGFLGSVDLRDVDKIVRQASQLDARDAYQNLLETSADYYQNGAGRAVTPNDVLRSSIAYRLASIGVDWNGKFGAFDDGLTSFLKDAGKRGLGDGTEVPKPGTYTTTYKSVDLMNPEDAKNLTRGMLQQELGRDPTQAEYEDFLATLHAAERSNPTTQTTTTKYVLDKNDSLRVANQNTVTHQGIGAEGLAQLAYEKAQSQPGWAEYQAVGTYFPALLGALSATVPGV